MRHLFASRWVGLAFVLLGLASPGAAATFTVTTAACGVPGSLHEAIRAANAAGPGPHTVAFDIPGSGVHTITLNENLPSINVEVMIDGTTQPGYAGSPLVAIGCDPNTQFGFYFTIPGTVRGLAIHSCGTAIQALGGGGVAVQGCRLGTDASGLVAAPNGAGIVMQGEGSSVIGGPSPEDRNIISSSLIGIAVFGAGAATIQGNFIGLDATGAAALPNQTGILIDGSYGGVLIGGTEVGEGNVISGNAAHAVQICCEVFGQSSDVTIQGNLVGTDASGTALVPNGGDGIRGFAGRNFLIGGTVAGAGNVISGNLNGIRLSEAEFEGGLIIQGNFVGTDPSSTLDLGNAQAGIQIASITTPFPANTIGTSSPGGPGSNVVAFNGTGVVITGDARDTIRGNSIFSNHVLGISLGGGNTPTPNDAGDGDTGPNGLQNYPIITSATQEGSNVRVVDTLNSIASAAFALDFYANPPSTGVPPDYLQGETWLGTAQVTTDSSGNVSFDLLLSGATLDPGARVSSTATDFLGRTSEFSQGIVLASTPLTGDAAGQSLTVKGMVFEAGATVTVGGIAAASASVVNDQEIAVFTPALPPGTVNDISVLNPSGLAGTLPSGFVAQFADVEPSVFSPFIGGLVTHGVTAGCGGPDYCPTGPVTRAQMAVFLLRARFGGPAYTPPPCTGTVFADVPCAGDPFDPWIEALASLNVTAGCGNGNYCPAAPILRQQMAVFLMKTLKGADYAPPACASPSFKDVPCSSPFAPWVYDLAARGITGGCAGGAYCPADTVLRQQMAVFLVKTFGLHH